MCQSHSLAGLVGVLNDNNKRPSRQLVISRCPCQSQRKRLVSMTIVFNYQHMTRLSFASRICKTHGILYECQTREINHGLDLRHRPSQSQLKVSRHFIVSITCTTRYPTFLSHCVLSSLLFVGYIFSFHCWIPVFDIAIKRIVSLN